MARKLLEVDYDSRHVEAHGEKFGPKVFLVNEAPGPSEACSGIPLYGQQGANLYHALRSAKIKWALDVNEKEIEWPRDMASTLRHKEKDKFLAAREKHITCTNAYDRWPRPPNKPNGFCAPDDDVVKGGENLRRLQSEIRSRSRLGIVLICGRCAYLACLGEKIDNPAKHEREKLTQCELDKVNSRLGSKFSSGWYLGHTRRWTLSGKISIKEVLREIATEAEWQVIDS